MFFFDNSICFKNKTFSLSLSLSLSLYCCKGKSTRYVPSLGVSQETCRNAILYVLYRLHFALEIASCCRSCRHLRLPTSCPYRYTYVCTVYKGRWPTIQQSITIPLRYNGDGIESRQSRTVVASNRSSSNCEIVNPRNFLPIPQK